MVEAVKPVEKYFKLLLKVFEDKGMKMAIKLLKPKVRQTFN